MGMFKKMIVSVAGAAATAYLTKLVTEALERKPLKTRMREGKEKVMDIKDTAVEKAQAMKAQATEKVNNLVEEKGVEGKVDRMAYKAENKVDNMAARAENKVDSLIDEKDQGPKGL